MTPKEAAEIIGCSAPQARWLIRKQRLKATKVKAPTASGFIYSLTKREVERYRKIWESKLT